MDVENISISNYISERMYIATKYGLPIDEIDEHDSNIIISHFMTHFMKKHNITEYIGLDLEFGDIADALNPQREPKCFVDTYADFEKVCLDIMKEKGIDINI